MSKLLFSMMIFILFNVKYTQHQNTNMTRYDFKKSLNLTGKFESAAYFEALYDYYEYQLTNRQNEEELKYSVAFYQKTFTYYLETVINIRTITILIAVYAICAIAFLLIRPISIYIRTLKYRIKRKKMLKLLKFKTNIAKDAKKPEFKEYLNFCVELNEKNFKSIMPEFQVYKNWMAYMNELENNFEKKKLAKKAIYTY